MQYVGIDWAYRRAAWCAKEADGTVSGEGFVPADEDGLARLVLEQGTEGRACLEMMSGAVWVRDRLAGAGWQVEVDDAQGQGCCDEASLSPFAHRGGQPPRPPGRQRVVQVRRLWLPRIPHPIGGVGRQAALSVERDDDLAVGAALLDVRQRLEGLVEGERFVDERAEVARVVEGGQLAQLGAVGLHEQKRVARA